MAYLKIPNIKLIGLAASVPKEVESNDDLPFFQKEELETLKLNTGIHFRRIARTNQTAADLCVEAASKLLALEEDQQQDIEVLVFVTQTPNQAIPGGASQLQTRLGLSNNCMVLDLNQGCAGYVYGLSVIASIMSAAALKKGLLLVGDTITKTLDKNDKSTLPIFSDAGSATLLEFDKEAAPLHFNLQSDGLKYQSIYQAKDGLLQMKGHDVFYFGSAEVPQNVKKLFEQSTIDQEVIDYFVFHQANLLLNEAIRRKLVIEKHKVPYSLEAFGNTSSATIPITMVANLAKQLQNENNTYLLSGFGVGLSCASVIINIADIVCPDIIEL